MIFKFIDINPKLAEAWKKVFDGIKNVEVHNASIFDFPSDAIVSPANSFGYMNGGIDFSISKNLGWHIEKKVQEKIRNDFFGELLVGQALIVETEHKDFPYLVSAPTMRTPMTITRSPNVYLAMKAILILLRYGKINNELVSNKIKSIAIPGLGTGVGNVAPIVCARQMRIAWEDVMNNKHTSKKGWDEIQSNWAYFYTLEKDDLKYDIP
jgi:O-acetyl-ADP-ribose deacetylase (regulator of RNase III)